MSVTIDSLDIQIRSSAGSAKQNIEDLAKALERLNGAAKVTKIVNSLERLNDALTHLRSNSGVMGQLSSLSQSLARLANIPKLTGLQSAIRELKKLPGVMNNLGEAHMTAFITKMRALATALTPLATQLDRIGTAFSRLPAQVSRVVTATNRMATATNAHGNALNNQSLNLMSAIQNLQDYLSMIHFVGDAVSKVMADAIEWDGIQFRFGRAFGEDAEEVYAYAQKVSDVLKINIQQFMQYSSLYGSLLSGFGMAQEKVTTISVGLTELSYDIWAAYNDRFKTLEDASEAVRSAITGEIEPIRNAGIALTEASLQEYIDSTHLAGVSIEKLTEAQKSEVRYAAMVNAAMNQGIVGTYAREMNTAEGAVRTLTQQMKTLGQALGSLFLPILQMVVPYLSAFVELITEGVAALAALLGIPFQEITWNTADAAGGMGGLADSAADATGSLGDAAKAAKKLKSYTMGFDELNIIDPSSGSGSGGAGGAGGAGGSGWGDGLDLKTLWDDSVFASASKQVDELKQKIKDWFEEWKVQIAIVSTALAALSMSKLLGHLGEAMGLGDKFLKTMSLIGKLASTAIIITLQYSLMTEFLSGYLDGEGFKEYIKAMFVGALGTWVLYSMWGPAGLVIGFGVVAAASLSAIIEDGGIHSTEGVVTALTGLAAAAGSVWVAVKKLKIIEKVTEWVRPAARAVQELVGAFKGLPLVSSSPLLSKLSGVFRTLGSAVSAVAGFFGLPVWATIAAIIAVIGSSAYFLYENWEKVTEAVKKFFKTNIVPKLEDMKESWEDIKAAAEPLVELFKDLADALGEFLKSDEVATTIRWLGESFEFLGGIIVGVLGGAVAGAFNTVVGIIEGFIQTVTGIVQIVSGVVQAVVGIFTGDWKKVGEAIELTMEGIANVFDGLWDMTVGAVIEFVEGVIGWFTDLWDELVGHSIVPDMIEAIVDWFLSLPGAILGPLETFVENVKLTFTNLWLNVQTWWTTNVAPKFTKEYWQQKFDTIREAIATKLEEAKDEASEKWKDITAWFDKEIAPKFTLTYWETTFDTVREAIGEKLAEVKKEIEDKWEDITSWYNQNVAPKLTLSYWLEKFQNIKTSLVTTIKTAINSAITLLNKLITWINEHFVLELPPVTILGVKVFDGLTVRPINIPLIPKLFATGGFPDMGQMFIAREAGPELVGRIGSRNAVVNNDQIVEGVAAGVYRAVVQAMNDTNRGSDQNVNVYLDGKQIYASIKRTEAERGVSLMGNQLGYAY